jgi:hypothetical protein
MSYLKRDKNGVAVNWDAVLDFAGCDVRRAQSKGDTLFYDEIFAEALAENIERAMTELYLARSRERTSQKGTDQWTS